MNDRKLHEKVWEVLVNRFLKFNKKIENDPLGFVAWTGILASAGCEVFPYHFPTEDTEEDIFVRDVALGNIRIPREVAMRMLVLGELP